MPFIDLYFGVQLHLWWLSFSLSRSLLDAPFPLWGLEIRLRPFFRWIFYSIFSPLLRSSFSRLTFYGNLIYVFSLPPEKQFRAKSHYRGVFVKRPVDFFRVARSPREAPETTIEALREGQFISRTNSLSVLSARPRRKRPWRVPHRAHRSGF